MKRVYEYTLDIHIRKMLMTTLKLFTGYGLITYWTNNVFLGFHQYELNVN